MDFFTFDEDRVVEGYVAGGVTTYRFALDHLAPLIGRLNIQRDTLKTKFYSRLEKDIVRGCVILVARVHKRKEIIVAREIPNYVVGNSVRRSFMEWPTPHKLGIG